MAADKTSIDISGSLSEAEEKIFARPYHDLRTPFTVDENGAFAEYIVQQPEKMLDLALGANVIITDRRKNSIYWVTGRIVGLRAISPFNPDRENLLYIADEKLDPNKVLDEIPGGPHTHQPMIIRVTLDGEMEPVISDDGKVIPREFLSNPIQRPPSSASRLSFPDVMPGDNPEPSLREILEVKKQGISLGNIGFGNKPYENDGKFLTYHWDVANLDNKHMFIIGESGSGKTVFLKNLAYEIRNKFENYRVILTDVQGDISQLLLFDVAEIIEPTLGWQKRWNKQREDNPDSAKKIMAPFQLVVPSSKSGMTNELAALQILAKKRGVAVENISLRLQDLSAVSDVEYLFRTTSEQVAMLLDGEAEYIRDKRGKSYVTVQNLKLVLQQALTRSSSQGASGKPSQITSNSGVNYYSSTYDAATRALNSLSSYFDVDRSSLNDVENPLDCLKEPGTTVIYLEHLDQEERIMWEMQLVKWLYDNKTHMANTFAFFDEAHQIIPARPSGIGSKETFDRLRNNFEKLAREGRKFGINLVLATQSPKDLHEIVPEQCPNRVVMKINPKNANAAFLDPELALIANRFGHGQFWFQSPFNGTPNWVRLHSWTPPVPHEAMPTYRDKAAKMAKLESNK
jgi:hypothetical protein